MRTIKGLTLLGRIGLGAVGRRVIARLAGFRVELAQVLQRDVVPAAVLGPPEPAGPCLGRECVERLTPPRDHLRGAGLCPRSVETAARGACQPVPRPSRRAPRNTFSPSSRPAVSCRPIGRPPALAPQ